MLDAASADAEMAADLAQRFAAALQPPPFMLPSEWAARHRSMSPEASSKQRGKWRHFPFQIEPLDASADPEVRRVVLMWASQVTGKSKVCLNTVAYFISQEPCPIQVVQPDLLLADGWSKDRLDTMIRDTPPLKDAMCGKGT